ncbi:MAG TPA: hypothetical protein VE991_13520 [Acidimicrobiales bacterium]|nr:hypothetical protein [Acidimicrobiales bacterium]
MSTEVRPADFDSATAMVQATARFLDGKGFPILGKPYGFLLRPVLVGLNQLPEHGRRWLYRVGSGREALAPEVLARTDAEALSRQVVERYPARRYRTVLIGSNPGSATHLAAALGAPLLPQTLLLPLRHRGVDLDEPWEDVAVARPVAEAILERNPELIVHHMADPTNDRLTLARFSYFRVKRTVLGPTYEEFLRHHLEPGGTVVLLESGHTWPTTELAPRYVFQFGGVGGLTPDEYLRGGERVATFLAAHGAKRRAWRAPEPDGERPEAEWGFEPALGEDVRRFCAEHGYRVLRLCFDEADDLSPFVAELYRWWYAQAGWSDDELFVESFVLLDPTWVIRVGVVPYWVTFNAEPGVARLERYLDDARTYRRIEATLISNGTWTPGLAGPERWKPVFARATGGGRFAGVDPERFPTDLAVFARYRDTLRSRPVRHAVPPTLDVADVEKLASALGPRYGVRLA